MSSTVTETLTSEVVTTSTDVVVPLEHLEQPPQEAVRHQHARRGDVDHGDAALAGERRDRRVAGAPASAVMQRAGRRRAAAS